MLRANRMSVSVLIVNFRTPDLTIDAIRSALDQPETTEVVVVDNDSGDDSLSRIEKTIGDHPQVKLIAANANVGFGRANNVAASHATGEWLFLLNSDATCYPGCLADLLSEAEWHPEAGILAPIIYWPSGEPQPDTFGLFPTGYRILTRQTKRTSDPVTPDWVSGCAMLIRRSDFVSVEGFDQDLFMYYEDVLLCRRVREHGKSVHRVASAGVTHLGGASRASSLNQKRQYYASQDVWLRRIGTPSWVQILIRTLRWPNLWVGRLRGAA